MGRPINKKHIGDGAGKIQVTAVKFAAGGEVTTESHIVNQRSANKFTVTDGSKTEVCTLVNKSIGGLGASEFCINVTDSDGVTKQITKMYNRKMQLEGSTRHKWSRDASGLSTAIEKTITGATAANPVVITSAGHGFSNGDKISISKVVGMVELNVETAFTIANKATNTFELSGVDGSSYTAYTSGGIATKAAATSGSIVVDAQAS
ncbi:MAG: hypothetical protein CMP33_03230 [Rickettsiales bacterium]|nr:hypothetical protein [Rickettsiales bacterium]|tara:strand:+ start:8444 stop:9061 length:618 start_codon:yes stop_codon:yes gene_type:complete